jgi:NADH-quinone oxidoreductase subunit F
VDSGEGHFVVEADQVIAAIGQVLDPAEVLDGTELKCSRRNFIAVNPVTGQTSVEWIFAGGDAASGPASVAEAVGCGEKAAVGIDLYLTGENHGFWREDKELDTFFDPEADPVEYLRAKTRLMAVAKRRDNFDEVELPWRETVASREAKRCLRCDYREESQL